MFMIARSLMLVLLCSGCSAFTMEKPPANHARLVAFHCTSNRVAPGLDLVSGIGWGVAAALMATHDQGAEYVGTGAALSTGFLASSIYGYVETSDCRDALSASEARANAGAMPQVRSQQRSSTVESLKRIAGKSPEDETLQATMGNSYFRVVLHGQPRRGGSIKLTATRQATDALPDRCSQISITLAGKPEQLPGKQVHATVPARESGFRWEMMTTEIGADRVAAIAETPSTRISACGTSFMFTRSQLELVKRFLSTWSNAAVVDTEAQSADTQETSEP
jgi:hypothetical protein